MSELGRMVDDIPQWTKHEPEGRKRSTPKPRVQSGLRFVGSAQSWCYICNAEHGREEAHVERNPRRLRVLELSPQMSAAERRDELARARICPVCGDPFRYSYSTRRYCGEACSTFVKNDRKRKDYDGRWD